MALPSVQPMHAAFTSLPSCGCTSTSISNSAIGFSILQQVVSSPELSSSQRLLVDASSRVIRFGTDLSDSSHSGSGFPRQDSFGHTRWPKRFTSKVHTSEVELQVGVDMEDEMEAKLKDREGEHASGPGQLTIGSPNAEHLIVLVNGIWGSTKNWVFAEKKLTDHFGGKVLIHCSAANSGLKTHSGVDKMGPRLANEVMEVVEKYPALTQISFIGHSLGGLISRYAIGLLYAPKGGRSLLQEWAEAPTSDSKAGGSGRARIGAPFVTHEHETIAGLEPVNFITLATPHLGCRGNSHLPFLFGQAVFEWAAPHVSPLFIGPTGRHLFLADGNKDKKPLLQRMVTDNDEGRFLSALRCFKRRIAYANVTHDRMVGWRTASIRKAHEMPEVLQEPKGDQKASLEKYKYIVRVEEVPLATDSSEPKDAPALDSSEEIMVTGLQQVPWVRVDVNFSKCDSLYEAHNLIQVKRPSAHSEGKYIYEHIVDNYF